MAIIKKGDLPKTDVENTKAEASGESPVAPAGQGKTLPLKERLILGQVAIKAVMSSPLMNYDAATKTEEELQALIKTRAHTLFNLILELAGE